LIKRSPKLSSIASTSGEHLNSRERYVGYQVYGLFVNKVC
jgi:hypothetical protein